MRKGNFKSIPTVMPHAREDEMMDAAELSRLSEIAARAAPVETNRTWENVGRLRDFQGRSQTLRRPRPH